MGKSLLLLVVSSLLWQTAQARIDGGYAQQRRQVRPCSEESNDRDKKECMKANNPHRFELKHIESKGIGYNQGYSSIDAFFTGKEGNYIPFVDLRGHVFNDGKWATNVGVGTRYICDPCFWIVGVNGYFDYRSTHSTTHFTQLGVGIETFVDRFDFRLNGYLPVGRKRKRTKAHIDSIVFKGFSGNYIVINEDYTNTYHGAMKGFNAELGVHLFGNRIEYDVYLGAGPYYFSLTEGKESWGGKARLKIGLTRCLFLEVSDSYDSIFRNRLQGTINVTIPFAGRRWMRSKTTCRNVMNWQAVMPPERQEIIVVSKFKKNKTFDAVAIDPTTGQPFYVVFVNNTNASLGNGTFENPYQNLTTNDNAVSAQSGSFAGNTIYVFEGDGTATHMSGGNMILQQNQRLLGSGNSYQYQTNEGLITIPAQTLTAPQITGTANNVIVLGNNNEVSGFNVTVPTSFNGVQSGSITGANINLNTFTGGLNTASLTGMGPIIFNNNQLNSSTSFTIQTGDLLITNNLIQNVAGVTVIAMAISVSSNTTALIENNTINNLNGSSASTGMFIQNSITTSGPTTVIIKDNSLSTMRTGITLLARSTASMAVIVEGNSIVNTTASSTFGTATGSSGLACVRFNNNIGLPSSASPPFAITGSGGLLSYEPLINNVPTPTPSGNVVQVPACTCGSCP